MSKTTNKYSPETRERAVRMVLTNEGQHASRWSAILSVSSKIGCASQTLNEWVKKAEVDGGRRAGVPTETAEKLKALERENRELKQANEILRKGETIIRHWSEDNGRAHILPRRSSTADRSHDRVHPLPVRVLPQAMSREGTIIVGCTGSSRSARCCRSPLPRITIISLSGPIRLACRIGPGMTSSCGPKSNACMRRTLASTAFARSGTRCAGRASISPVARSRA